MVRNKRDLVGIFKTSALAAIGPVTALIVWLSSLSFVPTPWPDDSAFYFVAKEFFKWPSRWVMLPQAPFEPSYKIWNFNTMPLYPILIGLGRFIGIDGSHALKLWPLSFWALSGSLVALALFRAGLPFLLSALVALLIATDPVLRWASVLIRPESLIGLFGIAMVLALSLPAGKRWLELKRPWLFDPIAILLALAAYAHFNAVHLLFAIVPGYFTLVWDREKPVPSLQALALKLVLTGARVGIYLTPWLITVFLLPNLFVRQMQVQWQRLAVGNPWLQSIPSAIGSIFQSMGSPEDWHPIVHFASAGMWILIIAAGLSLAFYSGQRWISTKKTDADRVSLLAPSGWVLGTVWLWNAKPEVWFTYYMHLSIWCFAGLALLKLWTEMRPKSLCLVALAGECLAIAWIFLVIDAIQLDHLSRATSWHWDIYHDFIGCIDRRLTQLAAEKKRPLSVWDPTAPDITVELSRRHPDWDFTRTNDFYSRTELAIQHGLSVDAVVVPETINWIDRDLEGPWSEHADVHSIWMDWRDYYLHRFMELPGWKPNRFLCQRGRWVAFIFE